MVISILQARLGNNFFQIAAGISLAESNNCDFIAIPLSVLKNKKITEEEKLQIQNDLKFFIERGIKISFKKPDTIVHYSEPLFSYNPIFFTPNIALEGSFQSYKYFNEKKVRDLFSIDINMKDYLYSKYGNILDGNITSINVRRGDYKKLPYYYYICSKKYYYDAMNIFDRNMKFLITSDDIKWCKRVFKSPNCFFSSESSPIADLYLASLCKNNIISNGTFSWWGAWLNTNPNKKVVSPANWFRKGYPTFSTGDLLPPDWELIDNKMPIIFTILGVFQQVYITSISNLVQSKIYNFLRGRK